MREKIVQTAGRTALGDFAPEFAHYNDDVLFGENWNSDGISVKQRCLLTVVALVSQGITDSSLIYHLKNAKSHGVSKEEMAASLTHIAFYCGWPKAWGAFRLAKDVYAEPSDPKDEKSAFENELLYPIGEKNDAYAAYFDGQSYLAPVANGPLGIHHVTFEPGCRNHWHIHKAKSGGGQVLLCTGGRGYYQEWGKEPIEMTPGKIIEIKPGVKHWHGAAPSSWFAHLSTEVPGEEGHTE